jgi:L-malate glycosyltransferase
VRILQISSARHYGGGERHFVELCRGLTARGHQVFVALRPSNEWQGHLDMIPPERVLHVSIRNSFGMFSAKRIARFARDNRIDIIHAHVARDYLAASIAARKSGIKGLVLTRHVMFPLKSFYRFALNNVHAAIAVSPAVRQPLEMVFPASKVKVIPNGIDFSAVTAECHEAMARDFRRTHSISDGVKIVSTLGELKVLKGQRDLVLAANELVKTVPNLHFIVAGRDHTIDQRFRRELRRLVRVFGMEDKFLWLDWIDDTRPFYAATDLFVSPSHSESFGLAMLEAMSMGTAVIASETDGAKELIVDREALVPIKDPVALAAAIQRFLTDDAERERLANAQNASATERFSIKTMIDDTEAVYRSAADAR